MLEKPNIPDELIISSLQEEYELHVAQLEFLPLGADMGTAVFRVIAKTGMVYFLKLRRGFEAITVTVPLLLKSRGIQEIIPPIETKSKHSWADFGGYKMILYPFIEGKDGFDRELTDHHRKTLGSVLKRIHTVPIPSELSQLLPRESFSSQWRDSLQSFQRLVETTAFDEPSAAKLAEFMKFKRYEISHIVRRAEELAAEVQSRPLEFALCHTDIHGGNILIGDDGQLYIVDWDNPLLAPKERDLMFIGGGIDGIWKSKKEEAVFYEGYGRSEINAAALAYYRYERVIEDLAVIGEQLLLTDEGGADREQAYRWFIGNFELGSTIEIAKKTYKVT